MLHTSQIKRTLYGLLSLQVPHRDAEDRGWGHVQKVFQSWRESEGRSTTTQTSCHKHTQARSLVSAVRSWRRCWNWWLIPKAGNSSRKPSKAASSTEQKWTTFCFTIPKISIKCLLGVRHCVGSERLGRWVWQEGGHGMWPRGTCEGLVVSKLRNRRQRVCHHKEHLSSSPEQAKQIISRHMKPRSPGT